jgi:hypothetical protein
MRTGLSPASIVSVKAWRTAAKASFAAASACSAACLSLFRPVGDREDRQQAVTDELQYLAAMALDRDRLCVENSVEHGDDAVARKPV